MATFNHHLVLDNIELTTQEIEGLWNLLYNGSGRQTLEELGLSDLYCKLKDYMKDKKKTALTFPSIASLNG